MEAIHNRNICRIADEYQQFGRFALDLGNICSSIKSKYERLNHELLEMVTSWQHGLEDHSVDFKFAEMRLDMEHLQSVGPLIWDAASFYEELKCQDLIPDTNLQQLKDLAQHYSYGWHNLSDFAILGIQLQPNVRPDIRKAYKRKCLQWHPDKLGCSSHPMMLRVSQAHENLKELDLTPCKQPKKPFEDCITGIGGVIRKQILRDLSEGEYRKVASCLSDISDLETLSSLTTAPLCAGKICEIVCGPVRSHIKQAHTTLDTNWSQFKLEAVNANIEDLQAMEACFINHPNVYQESWSATIFPKVIQTIKATVDAGQKCMPRTFDRQAEIFGRQAEFIDCLVKLGRIFDQLQQFRDKATDAINKLLDGCLEEEWGFSFLFQVGIKLRKLDNSNNEDARIGQVIVSEFNQFKDVLTVAWNEQVMQKPADQVLDGFEVDCNRVMTKLSEPDRTSLLEMFETYTENYNRFLETYLAPDAPHLNELVKMIGKKARSLKKHTSWGSEVVEQIPFLLAGIFAHFTVIKSGDSFHRLGDQQNSEECNMLLKPHNIQVFTVLLLFLRDTNHLMQVRTGEGKSIILGATATLLGLLGFRVHCVCFSEYLSDRDSKLFADTFRAFSVTKRIKYSTINEYTEAVARDAHGSIRNMTLELIKSKSKTLSNTPQLPTVAQDREILLVDEVDVLFGEHFYGKTINPAVHLQEPEIQEILQMVWEHRGRVNVQATSPYARLLKKYPGWNLLFDTAIKQMVSESKTYQSKDYTFDPKGDRIGVKNLDGISYNTVSYGLTFAHFEEYKAGRLKNLGAAMQRVGGMIIGCGSLSYAKISPWRISGLSGTLHHMGQHEKGTMKAYTASKPLPMFHLIMVLAISGLTLLARAFPFSPHKMITFNNMWPTK